MSSRKPGSGDERRDHFIPVLRPRLPRAEHLLPYLLRIDETRLYTNRGPLVAELEDRLCEVLGVPNGAVVSAASGTAALVGAILATAGRATEDQPYAIVPAYTFAATALAAELCGYRVFLADVAADSWMLDAERLAGAIDLPRAGVVIPVAPFGRPVPQDPWRDFRKETGIPVVIDGAASFETAAGTKFLGEIPVAMSFHATKSFSTGEGGCVITSARELSDATMRSLDFGFGETRETVGAGFNGKLSEYHAAVGLAEFDAWEVKRAELLRVADRYQRAFAVAGLSERLTTAPDSASCYVLFRSTDEAERDRVETALAAARVDYRQWYGRGLQHEAHFREAPREQLETAGPLASLILGLPVACDLSEDEVVRIARTVAGAARSSS